MILLFMARQKSRETRRPAVFQLGGWTRIEMNSIRMQRKPQGYEALACGNIIQQRAADSYKELSFGVHVDWGHDEPYVITTLLPEKQLQKSTV